MVKYMSIIPALRKLKQEDSHKFKAGLCLVVHSTTDSLGKHVGTYLKQTNGQQQLKSSDRLGMTAHIYNLMPWKLRQEDGNFKRTEVIWYDPI